MTQSQSPQIQYPYYYHRLPNGMEMIGQHMPSVGSAVFAIQIDAGLQYEGDDELGLSQLLDDMLYQGTDNRNARQITNAIELLGARRISSAGFESARHGAQLVHTKLDDAISLWAEILLHPTFPEKELQQLKPLLLQAIKRRDDEPSRRGGELLSTLFFRNSRLARPTLGVLDTVNSLTVEHLKRFYDTYFHANRAVFAIAGSFDWEHVVAKVTELFGSWSAGADTRYRDTPDPITTMQFETSPGEQEHLFLEYPSVTWDDPDYYANALGIEVFGGGMTSRLFSEVREKRGLVYSVAAYPQAMRAMGSVIIYAGSEPEKARETLQVVLQEMQKFGKEGITEDELERAKIQLKSEYVMQSESAAARLNSILRSWWFERRFIPMSEVKTAIQSVTTDQVRNVLKRFPPWERVALAGVGPTNPDEITKDLFPPIY